MSLQADHFGPVVPASAAGLSLPRARSLVVAVLAAALLVLCVAPFVLVFAVSFGEKIEGAGWRFGFDLAHYQRFFVGAMWPETVLFIYVARLFYALLFAVAASVLAMLTAFPFVYLMTRQSRRAQAVWLVVILSSLSLSEVFVVMGWDILLSNGSGLPMVLREIGVTAWLKETGWLAVLRDWGMATPRDVRFKTSDLATILTMAYLVWPFAVILLYPALSRLDPALVEAARTMGARPFTVIRTVVLPAVRVPLIGSTVLLFVYLLGAYVVVTVFTDPAHQTISVTINEAARGSQLNAPFAAAQSVMLLVTAALLLAANQWIMRRSGAAR